MVAITAKPTTRQRQIPKRLIKETINGVEYPYLGYRQVMSGKKKLEEIMGSGTYQGALISYLLRLLYRQLDEKKYEIYTNEIGFHISKNNNFSSDIVIFEREKLIKVDIPENKYFNIPPKVVIEVDMDVDDFSEMGYVNNKTKALLDFGAEKVIWVFSSIEKVLVATPNSTWQLHDWNNNIDIIETIDFNIAKHLQNENL
jgi:Uma2 family endonuclease